MRKVFDNIAAKVSLDVEAMSAATTGAHVIDTQGFDDAMLVAVSGDVTSTTGDTYRIKLMECDTSTGSFSDTGIFIDFVASTGAASSNIVKQARVSELNVTRMRFLRVDLALTASTSAWEGTGILVLGGAVSAPVNTD